MRLAHGNLATPCSCAIYTPSSRLEQRLVEGAECLRLNLGHLAVVSEQAVDLALDIGGLCVDACSDAAALEVEQPGRRLAVALK